MPNPFAKSRKPDSPYAIYRCGDFTWHVLKTYKMPKSEDKDPYARWLVAAKSDATYGSFELGDTYKTEVERYGTLVAATPEWLSTYGNPRWPRPTPAEYLEQA